MNLYHTADKNQSKDSRKQNDGGYNSIQRDREGKAGAVFHDVLHAQISQLGEQDSAHQSSEKGNHRCDQTFPDLDAG